jgi:oligoendopeptidase F
MSDGKTFKVVRLERRFLPATLKITSWEDVRPFFDDLEEREPEDMAALERWLADRSELAFVLEEDLAWRYIRMNCHTDREDYSTAFNAFVMEIEPEISRRSDRLDGKLLAHPLASALDDSRDYGIMMRIIRNRKRLFREENVPLQAELQVLEQDYGRIASQMTVTMEGKEMTLQQASNYLREPERALRKEAFLKIRERRYADAGRLDDLFDTLVKKRTEIARNAGFPDYREYRFAELGRFDYTVEDCETFHASIRTTVMPLWRSCIAAAWHRWTRRC